MTPEETDKRRILEIQKELINEILEYQIRYGAATIGWNVNVQFVMKAGEPSIHIGFQNTTDIQASGGGGGCCNHEEYIKSIQQQRGEP